MGVSPLPAVAVACPMLRCDDMLLLGGSADSGGVPLVGHGVGRV